MMTGCGRALRTAAAPPSKAGSSAADFAPRPRAASRAACRAGRDSALLICSKFHHRRIACRIDRWRAARKGRRRVRTLCYERRLDPRQTPCHNRHKSLEDRRSRRRRRPRQPRRARSAEAICACRRQAVLRRTIEALCVAHGDRRHPDGDRRRRRDALRGGGARPAEAAAARRRRRDAPAIGRNGLEALAAEPPRAGARPRRRAAVRLRRGDRRACHRRLRRAARRDPGASRHRDGEADRGRRGRRHRAARGAGDGADAAGLSLRAAARRASERRRGRARRPDRRRRRRGARRACRARRRRRPRQHEDHHARRISPPPSACSPRRRRRAPARASTCTPSGRATSVWLCGVEIPHDRAPRRPFRRRRRRCTR